MKYLFYILFITLIPLLSNATSYYVASSGSDANNGTSASTPWQTLTKVNSGSYNPGDNIYFNRGNTFYGELIITSSGNSFSQIYISSYGTGARPIITGLSTISSWTSVGGGIYKAACASCTVNDNVVLLNGNQVSMGRWPNTGYKTISASTSNTNIVDNSLTNSPNWTGGQVVIKEDNWRLSVNLITNHFDSSITYTPTTFVTPTPGYGYFIQNDSLTLDTLWEWYYSASTGNMWMYFGSNTPSTYTVQSATVDTLISVRPNVKWVIIDNIDVVGSTFWGIYITGSDSNIVVQNCTFNFSGNAAYFNNGQYCKIINSNINHSNGIGIVHTDTSSYIGTFYDTVENSGTIAGQDRYYSIQLVNPAYPAYIGIVSLGYYGQTEYNRVDTCGYDGILTYYDSTVDHNEVNYFCYLLMDGGGIYHVGYTDTTKVHLIFANVISNGIGNTTGTTTNFPLANGIYIDQNNYGIHVDSNTIYNCNGNGVLFHDARSCHARNNTIYNSSYNPGSQSINMDADNLSQPVENDTMTRNIVAITSSSAQFLAGVSSFVTPEFWSNNTGIIIDSNYYSFTVGASLPIFLVNNGANHYVKYTSWLDTVLTDIHSKFYLTANQFYVNNTAFPVTYSLAEQAYSDVYGNYYTNFITVQPFSSVILFYAYSSLLPNRRNANRLN